MKHKFYLGIVIALFAVLLLTACAAPAAPTQAPEPTESYGCRKTCGGSPNESTGANISTADGSASCRRLQPKGLA